MAKIALACKRVEDGIQLEFHERVENPQTGETGWGAFPDLTIFIHDCEIQSLREALLGGSSKPAKARKKLDRGPDTTRHFDAFWELYPNGPAGKPRRVNRETCRTIWASGKLDDQWPDIKAALDIYLPVWARDRFEYVPMTTTFLRQRRWESVERTIESPMI